MWGIENFVVSFFLFFFVLAVNKALFFANSPLIKDTRNIPTEKESFFYFSVYFLSTYFLCSICVYFLLRLPSSFDKNTQEKITRKIVL